MERKVILSGIVWITNMENIKSLSQFPTLLCWQANVVDYHVFKKELNPYMEMATHSSILAWEILWTKKPGRLQSTRSQKNWTWMSNWTHTHTMLLFNISSVQFSHSVVSDYLWPHELQHARSPCPSPTPRVYSDSHPSSQWCHPATSSSVVPFYCTQSLPASESFPMSQLFVSGGQSIGV